MSLTTQIQTDGKRIIDSMSNFKNVRTNCTKGEETFDSNSKDVTTTREASGPRFSLKSDEEKEESARFFTPPTYTMKDIHSAIPTHCFERSTRLSLGYILRDFISILCLFILATQIPKVPSTQLRSSCWILYSFTQGLVFTGIWELAHECGHQALSPSRTFSNVAGLIMHSFLLVPYHSWRFTHSQHHKATNNIERDIAFVPDTKEVWLKAREERMPQVLFSWWDLVEDMPIVNFVILVGHQFVAWPIYLGINNFALPRMRAYPWWTRSHFYFGGGGPNFKPTNRNDIIISTLGVGVTVACLLAAIARFDAHNVFLYYGAPWLWTNHWILTITFLQHTDPSLPYYPSKTWSFLRGCASTIDRDFGIIGRYFFHGAINFHVLHHHASRIPFYHAEEASNAIRGVMSKHYRADMETPYLWAFWKNYNACQFVEEKDLGAEIYFFGEKSEL